MPKTPPPGLTRFTFDIRPKNGGNWINVYCDLDQIVVPKVGGYFGLDPDYGITVEISEVGVYPTADPVVWVRGRSLVVGTASEANEIAVAAVGYGWTRRG